MKPGSTVDFSNNDGNVIISNDGNVITVDLASKVTIGSGSNAVTINGDKGEVVVGNTTINQEGISIENGPSLTQSGIDAGDKLITGVGSGLGGNHLADITGDDLNNAVNVGDLQSVVGEINTQCGSGQNRSNGR